MSGAAEGIAGLALSAVSIAALFTTCIDCYNLVVAARDFGEDYELLCTELSLQKLRFFLWGESVGLACRTPDAQPQPHPGLDDPIIQPTIIRTLNAIKHLLSETQELDERYGFKVQESATGAGSRGLNIFKATFDQFKSHARRNQKQKSVASVTRWAIFDADTFEVKITRLKGFIDGLESVTKSLVSLETQQARLQDEIESVSDVQSLRLLADVSDISETASRRLNSIKIAASEELMSVRSRSNTPLSTTTFFSAKSTLDLDHDPEALLISHSKADRSAPVIRIGISLVGRDQPSIVCEEIRKTNSEKPDQKTPQWRVVTSINLLRRFSVTDDLYFNENHNSSTIMAVYKRREAESTEQHQDPVKLRYLERAESFSSAFSNPLLGEQDSISCKIQDSSLTIDSNHVELLNERGLPDEAYDFTSTLVEVNLFSMRDLMINYRAILQSGQRNLKYYEILPVLDIMMNDVRRLRSQSPRLFRMSTRALIAQSKHTCYGVDYGHSFETLTTSEGLRKLLQESAGYFLSLGGSKIVEQVIRPRFLQMLIVLLSFLNNDDLAMITEVLERTFHIPGDRPSLELLIMKVLPLSCINPELFLEALFDAQNPLKGKESYATRFQSRIWEELQLDFLQKGFILPMFIRDISGSRQRAWLDPETMLELDETQSSLSDNCSTEKNEWKRSFIAAWPKEGVASSAIFRYLQHDGKLRERLNSTHASFGVINDIPPLEISSDELDNSLLALFTNKVTYRVSATDADAISAMKKGVYILNPANTDAVCHLEIQDEILNEPFIQATKTLNDIIQDIKSDFEGGHRKRRSFLSRTDRAPNASTLAKMEEPEQSRRFWADILPQGEGNSLRSCCAEVFKMRDRMVYQVDIIRDMNSLIRRLTAGFEKLDREVLMHSVNKIREDHSGGADQLMEKLRNLRGLINDAKYSRDQLQKMSRSFHDEPILRVIYPNSFPALKQQPAWQDYQTQLSKDKTCLIVNSRKLIVETILSQDGHTFQVTFVGINLIVSAAPLTLPGTAKKDIELRAKDIVLWLGYYLVIVEASEMLLDYRIVDYLKVQSQEVAQLVGERQKKGNPRNEIESIPMSLFRLV